ncbi:probable inactive shikimate kinase like 1, chloroplastic isoform X2 [Gastrolobium bilobum]|uniref:probable inactive shikimate kinase like 1, chloroplastic isoform X2 n=1 Tax=Gastrolobium bilobum TaxID=150636 RepID=UPI002AAF1462|nr:probable inactive shikimate kinase like 1, chloroplastic isoform X2 [Gastrolobium bilobum]
MEKASTRFSHMNNTSASLPSLARTCPFQFQLHTSTLTFSTHLTHTNPLRVSCPSYSYPFHRLPSANCSIPDGTTPTSVTMVAVEDSCLALKKAAEVSPELKGTSIFLVGMKSSLKTSLGKLLADILRYYYFDSDSLVEEATGGTSAAKSFRESDEKGFCESETEVLKQLSSMGRLVVCVGNGAVQSSTNLALLRHGISLWIDVPLDIVARDVIEDRSQFASIEISTSGSYPEVTNELGALYNKYRDGYATADAIISVQKVASRLGYDNLDDITREDMTLEALREIEKLTRIKMMMEEAARPF